EILCICVCCNKCDTSKPRVNHMCNRITTSATNTDHLDNRPTFVMILLQFKYGHINPQFIRILNILEVVSTHSSDFPIYVTKKVAAWHCFLQLFLPDVLVL